MGEVKPWQIILVVVALGVLAFSAWRFGFKNRVSQPEGILLVDVVTGKLYDTRKGEARGLLLPARHPITGERTLFPVERVEDGSWRLRSRYSSTFQEMTFPTTVVDGDLTVRVESDEAEIYIPKIPGSN
jgi:hypothetical protein